MKKYFFITDNEVSRLCPSCGNYLNYICFLNRNTESYKIPSDRAVPIFIQKEIIQNLRIKEAEFKKIWYNPSIIILCCDCVKLFKEAENLKQLDIKELEKKGFSGTKLDLLEEFMLDELSIDELLIRELPVELLKEFDMI